MKKTAALALILISLMTLGVFCIRPVKAQYQGSITINADGSVTPSSAPIKQTGNIYTLTSDVYGSISVERSNIIFDGNGHAIIGGGNEIGMGGLSIGYGVLTSGLSYTSNVTVEDFNVTGSYFGISLWETSNVIVANNTITGTGGPLGVDEGTAGIFVEGGGSNIITGNSLVNNYDGMSFGGTENNLIVGNTLTGSSNPFGASSYGLIFWEASNNTIYHNNFVNNTAQAGDADSINIWDNGYPSGGNYWSDYKTVYPQAIMIDSSGIGNTPYIIDSQNKDRYPLMEPFSTSPPKISVLSPIKRTYNESSVPLVFAVDKSVNWVGYSLDGKQNVTITGNSTIANMANGLHSITVYANDTFGDIGASQTIAFTVAKPEPFPTIPVAAVSGASAVVVAGLLVFFKKRKRQA